MGNMEQINIFGEQSWKDVISDILDKIIAEEELPEQSLVLAENFSEKTEKITSYTVSVKKPDYPRGINTNGNVKTSLFKIQPKTNKKEKSSYLSFSLPDEIVKLLESETFDVEVKKTKTDTSVLIDPESKDFPTFSTFIIKNALDAFMSSGGSAFGCCDRYKECSDAKKCVHDNRLYALGCAYYRNLRAGRIFYGKNRNI